MIRHTNKLMYNHSRYVILCHVNMLIWEVDGRLQFIDVVFIMLLFISYFVTSIHNR